MNVHHAGPAHAASRSTLVPVVTVLTWVFVCWPASWILLVVNPAGALLFGIASTVAMVAICAGVGRSKPAGPPALPAPVAAHMHAVRRDVESLAAVTPIGGCGWCGSLIAHTNDEGHPIPPRHWHAVEIEDRIRAKLQG